MRSKNWLARLTLSLAAMALWAPLANLNAKVSADQPRRIEIVAKRFTYTPDVITLKKGEPVALILDSTDVAHGLSIKDLGVNTEIKKGQAAELDFTPTKVGTFVGKCSHFCGKGHGSMIITVNVVE